MATPSDNLESMARTLEDISLFTQATNMSLNGINGSIKNGQSATVNGIKEMTKEVRFMSTAIVNLSKNILAKVGKAIFAPSVRRSNKTEEEIAADAEEKRKKAEAKAAAKIQKDQERAIAKQERLEASALRSQQREEQDALREERKAKALIIKEEFRAASEASKAASREEANRKRQEKDEERSAKQKLDSTPEPNFKNVISGAAGGLGGLFASVAIETRNFLASIIRAYGEGGLGGLIKASAQAATIFTQMPNALMSIVKAATPFVAAIDPGLMAKLALTFADLMATIGYGLRPIIVYAIAAIRLFADMLLPVMKAMAPAMNMLARSLVQMVVPILDIWVKSISYLVPVIQSLAPLFTYIGQTIGLMAPIIAAGLSALAIALNGVLGVISLVVGAIQTMVVGILQAGAYIVSWIPGTGDTSKNMEKVADGIAEGAAGAFGNAKDAFGRMFENPQVGPMQAGASAGMAAKGASFAGIGDLGKNLMQAAFGSSTEKIAMDQLAAQKEANGILQGIAGALVGGGGAKMAGVRN